LSAAIIPINREGKIGPLIAVEITDCKACNLPIERDGAVNR
jgi:hypothetical protein